MQERNALDETLSTQRLDDISSADSVKKIAEALQKKEVDHVVIGNLPNRGDTFTLNGLHYVVKFVDYKRGEIRIKLFTPEKTF